MSNRSETFGRLLKGAINSIAAYEGKTAPAIEDELGAQIGVAGTAIQRYKAGHLPPEPRAIQILAEAAVRRGFLSRAWLQRFLQATRYPHQDALIAQLADALGLPSAPGTVATLPTGTLAFLFTDIVGSTVLWERQPQAMERALARHDALLRQAIDADGGQVVRTAGDAFHAVFTTAAAALDAALAIQRSLAAEPWGPVGAIQVRVAVHVGTAQLRDGDYFGPPLNRVARLLDTGHGGQILLSLSAQELVYDQLPPGVSLRDLGEHRLKDLGRPEHIYQVVAPDLPADFPALRTLDAYRHNLPAQATPLIGREAEVVAVCSLLRQPATRLLTLTGPGGIGKTRLALQAAAELLDGFRDGITFVPLAPIRDPELVLAAIAQALAVTEGGGQSLDERVRASLRQRQLLLVLDNFEHVAAAAALVRELLATAPEIKILITSREVLHLYGEQEYAVPPLALPDLARLPPLARLTQYEAVRLFIERAQAVRPDFAVTADNAPAIAEICTRLDGLPLAIELAAARSKLFPPRALLARLDKRLALLIGGPRDLPARQQTLRSAIAWSFDLLSAADQVLFARLGVFGGGCTLEAAEGVLGDDRQNLPGELAAYIPANAVLDGLASLVDQSLLKQLEGVGGEPRFMMLETIREYALEQPVARGEADAIRQRHATFFLELAEEAEPWIRFMRPERDLWLEQLEVEHDNLRAALAWFRDRGETERRLRLAGALGMFWSVRFHWGEGRAWLEAALAQNDTMAGVARARALVAAAHLIKDMGDIPTARAYIEEGLALLRELGDKVAIAHALFLLGQMMQETGAIVMARACAEESLALFDAVNEQWGRVYPLHLLGTIAQVQGDVAQLTLITEEILRFYRQIDYKRGIGIGLCDMGVLAQLQGDWEHAVAFYAESLPILEEQGAKSVRVIALHNLGGAVLHQGDARRAATCFAEGLTLSRGIGYQYGIAMNLAGMAGVAAARGQSERSARLFGAADGLFDTMGMTVELVDRREYDRNREIARTQLGEEAFAEAWAAGRMLPLDEAIGEALAFVDGVE
jgi:predicted ATPase/class 3 adenylate cyclase